MTSGVFNWIVTIVLSMWKGKESEDQDTKPRLLQRWTLLLLGWIFSSSLRRRSLEIGWSNCAMIIFLWVCQMKEEFMNCQPPPTAASKQYEYQAWKLWKGSKCLCVASWQTINVSTFEILALLEFLGHTFWKTKVPNWKNTC